MNICEVLRIVIFITILYISIYNGSCPGREGTSCQTAHPIMSLMMPVKKPAHNSTI